MSTSKDGGPAMSPEAQRIAIAEACGWTHEREFIVHPEGDHMGYAKIEEGRLDAHFKFPSYPTDLNAMHEAELRLNWNEQESSDLFNYRCALHKLMGNDPSLWGFATAAQRAEAFLRTIGKWSAARSATQTKEERA